MSVTSTPKGSDLELDALREQIARVIQPACPEVIDGLLAKSKPEMHGRILATWFGPDVFAKADAILSLISAARKGQGEWRDIRSAPKDGTPFLAYRAKSRRAEVVRWVAPYEKAGVAFGGEFVKAASGWQLDVIWELHTHWMPLPPPSKQEE